MSDVLTLGKVKTALRITTDQFDDQLYTLIEAAQIDLGIAGVILPDSLDAVVTLAIETFCQLHFGESDQYDRLKRSYDEQKAQLSTATGYTDFNVGAS